jgi:hypothetical protein
VKTKAALLLVIFTAVALALGCVKNATNESGKNPPATQGGSELAPVAKSGEHENFKILEKRLTAEDIAECKRVIEKHFEALKKHDVELLDSTMYNPTGVKTGPDDPQILRIKEAKVYRINENPRWFSLESLQGAGISRLSGKTWYKVAILNVDRLLVLAYENSKEVWRNESNVDYILVKEKPESPWVILDAGR